METRGGENPLRPKNPLTSLQFPHTDEQFFYIFFLSFLFFFSIYRSIDNYFSIRYFHFTLLRRNSISFESFDETTNFKLSLPSPRVDLLSSLKDRATYLYLSPHAHVISKADATSNAERPLEIEIARLV